MPTWTVTIEQGDTTDPLRVQYTLPYLYSEPNPEYGYPCDETLGMVLGMALRAASPTDEAPWLLASFLNLMEYLATYTDEHRILGVAAKLIWEAFGDKTDPDEIAKQLEDMTRGILSAREQTDD